MSITDLNAFMDRLELTKQQHLIGDQVIKEIRSRLGFLIDVGLDYLMLSRATATLSGGEAQRIRLATQIGSGLVGVAYILDEPSIGLHQRDNDKLLKTLKNLRDLGNTLIVVEHDEDTMLEADWIVDIGPGAGEHGGYLVAEGTAQDIMKCEKSVTGAYLSGRIRIPVPSQRRQPTGFLHIIGAAENNLKHINVLITSYDMLKRDIASYDNLHFHYQIIDEAQYIKNHRTQAARSVCSIHSVTRFALTGTPIENRLSELWSIFEYLMPGFLYPYAYFRSELEQPIVENKDQIAATRLQQLVRPFIMRRLKTDVLKELPDKLEHAVYAQMTDEQNKLYTANALKLQNDLEQQSDSMFKTSKIQILAELTKLRQLCCDPSLIYQNYHGGSAKLDTCIQLIENAMAGGHKILLFSQFTSMLDVIERRLKAERILYYRLDGSTKSEQRTRLVNAFNENKIPVFLISLKAGGTGLNLTGADIVIHYDPWWNAAAQNQATDRAHRIGQTHTVTVYKLIARHTIEEKILELQENKKALSDQILSEEGVTASHLTKEELLQILQN
jgi:ABC-type multidrug transport system ATPase subunit